MEGRIAAQMDRSNTLMEGMKTLMESVLASNEALHADFMTSRERSQAWPTTSRTCATAWTCSTTRQRETKEKT